MDYRYFHDAAKKILYRAPVAPNSHAIRKGQKPLGKLTDWYCSMEIDIVRADNRLENHRWKYNRFELPHHHYPANTYSEQEARHYFMLNFMPNGDEISEAEYLRLAAQYEPEQ